MTGEGGDTGAVALAACTACAVQLGADPLVAPLLAGVLALLVRRGALLVERHGPRLAGALFAGVRSSASKAIRRARGRG